MNGIAIMAQSISPKLIERGEITKYVLHKTESYEVALLELSPGAKIKRHPHTADRELYFLIENKVATVCDLGEEHELENLSTKVLQVVSIKVAAGVTIPSDFVGFGL